LEGAPGRVQETISGSRKIDSFNFRVKFLKMNFEFDPNDNIDRAADGNDLQDIRRLGGEGGLFDRVPGRSQVGAAN
jgi:hypothetical protein